MDRTWLFVLLGILLVLVFVSCFLAIYYVLRSFTRARRRIRLSELRINMASGTPPRWLLAACLIRSRSMDDWAQRRQQLAAAGIRIDAGWYACLKRISVILCGLSVFLIWTFRQILTGFFSVNPLVILSVASGLTVCLLCDRYFLDSLKRYRTNRIVEEIFTVSRQLLYFSGSPLNLHSKLARCLTYTKLIRQDWHLLLNDWYHDAEGAIARFRLRLGTEEAYGFAETLQYLRLYDSDAYYSLLRQRVQDYKERLEMLRDSRKESASYVLFVVAAIPIMYTFQIFIYPWVQEGQRLFQSLN